jgi:hypothetical protein
MTVTEILTWIGHGGPPLLFGPWTVNTPAKSAVLRMPRRTACILCGGKSRLSARWFQNFVNESTRRHLHGARDVWHGLRGGAVGERARRLGSAGVRAQTPRTVGTELAARYRRATDETSRPSLGRPELHRVLPQGAAKRATISAVSSPGARTNRTSPQVPTSSPGGWRSVRPPIRLKHVGPKQRLKRWGNPDRFSSAGAFLTSLAICMGLSGCEAYLYAQWAIGLHTTLVWWP